MKPFNKILCAAFVAFTLQSCEKALDISPKGKATEAQYWQTEEDAKSAIYGVYADFSSEFEGSEGMYGRGYFWLGCVSDDMVIGRSRPRVESMRNFTCTGDEGEIKRLWTIPYLIIKRANDVLRNVSKMDINEEVKERILGEAYFISGLMYLQLAPMYGDDRAGIPILDIENPEDYNLPRAEDVSENYDYIIKMFSEAEKRLPFFEELDPSEYGRAHKTAAWAYMAKAYLYAKNYAMAEKWSNDIINSKRHDLLKPFSEVFEVNNNWSSEYIWSALGSVNPIQGSMLPGVMLENKGWTQYNGWGYFKPTKELYDSYEAGDERREATILIPGDTFEYFGEENFEYVPADDGYHTLMQFKKYMAPFRDRSLVSANGDYPTTALNVPLMRYAEVILIAAEAKLMQSKNADAEMNMIRERANLGKLSGATMTDLKRERRSELAGEINYRHFDLVRWGDAKAAYSEPAHKFNGATALETKGRDFDPETQHVWPIPPSEISASNNVLKQNEGW